MRASDVERIVLESMGSHGCHTAILYGSWARGTATPESDIDVLLVSEAAPARRDARVVDGVYLDAFIYPDKDLVEPKPELLRILGGRVVRERNGFGGALLARVQRLHDDGPPALAEDERQVILLWSRKMLERIAGQTGVEANYRRMQLLMQAVEDYFVLRGAWFRGPLEAFAWLREHDRETYALLERALQPDATDDALAEAVRAVYAPLVVSIRSGE